MNGNAPRFEARPHPTSMVPGVIAVWDHQGQDWAREPGPGREPRTLVSADHLKQWMANEGISEAELATDQP